MNIEQNDSLYLRAPKHIDAKYHNENNARYPNVEAVYARIPKAERVLDGVHIIAEMVDGVEIGVEYWFHATTDVLEVKTITLNEANLVHRTGDGVDDGATEVITTRKEFTAPNTPFNGVRSSVSEGASIEGYSTGEEGYGVVGYGTYVPLQGTTLLDSVSGVKLVQVLNATPTVPELSVEVGYGLEHRIDMPWRGNNNCKPMFRDDFLYTDITMDFESGKREWWGRKGGAWVLQGTLDENGDLYIAGNLYADNSAPVGARIYEQEFTFPDIEAGKVYTLTLDASVGSVIKGMTLRCDDGTLETTLSINTTDVVGCSSVTASNVKQSFTAIGANTVAIGNEITLTIVSLSGATSLTGVLKSQR